MPFVFVVLGIMFLVVAIRGTQGALFSLLQSEFTGKGSFVPWAASIFILGAIGYVRPVKPIADAMIGLVLLVIILGNKGAFFGQLNKAVNNPVAAPVPAQDNSSSSSSSILDGIVGSPSSNPTSSVPGGVLNSIFDMFKSGSATASVPSA